MMMLQSVIGPRARVFVPNLGSYIVYLIQIHTEIDKIVFYISVTCVHLHFFCTLTCAIVYVLLHHIIFRLYLYLLNHVLTFFKYSCANSFHRRILYTFFCLAGIRRLDINTQGATYVKWF